MAFSTETNANVIPPEGNVSTPSLLSRSHLSPVATCRQTVEALLAPLSTAWQRMATKSRGHLSPVATCRQTVEALLAPLSTAWQRMASAPVKAIE